MVSERPIAGCAAAEFALPVAVGENDRLGSVGQVVAAREEAAQGGLDAEQRQGAVGDVEARHVLGLSHAGDA